MTKVHEPPQQLKDFFLEVTGTSVLKVVEYSWHYDSDIVACPENDDYLMKLAEDLLLMTE